MLIKYEFVNGDVSEVEVSDEIGTMIIESRKAEHAQDERRRYHCYSLDAISYEGLEYGYYDDYEKEEREAEAKRRRKLLNEGFSKLTPTQKRRLFLYIKGKTLREIAELEGSSFQSVDESIKAAQKKFQNIFSKHPDK